MTIGLGHYLTVAAIGWTGAFSPIITPDDVANGKPHPESLERILELTGLAPADLLMVGPGERLQADQVRCGRR